MRISVNRQGLTSEGRSPYQSCLCFATKAILQLSSDNSLCLLAETLPHKLFFLFDLDWNNIIIHRKLFQLLTFLSS